MNVPQPKFIHHDLRLLNPSFDSPLIDVISELEHLRRLRLEGNTPTPIFFQLKRIFHMLESLGSARIEGNHTTLADYIETQVQPQQSLLATQDQHREIANIEAAMNYVDESITPGAPITEHFIRQLHQKAVENLQREGDRTPGAYRMGPVLIQGAHHLPPDAIDVNATMRELVDFINTPHPPKYDLMKVALAHHRFGWIHPFGNGNGRVVRLLTYALLLKYGFNVNVGGGVAGRVLNPTAVFCNDRGQYYEMLATADSGSDEDLEKWCTYVLGGMLDELRKLDRLTDFDFLRENILHPAIRVARERENITKEEETILRLALNSPSKTLRAGDLVQLFPDSNVQQRTYKINGLLKNDMLIPIVHGARQYTVGFANNYLLRGVIGALTEQGFVPPPVAKA